MGFRKKQKTLNLLFINKTQKLFHYGLSKSTIQMEHLNMDWIKKNDYKYTKNVDIEWMSLFWQLEILHKIFLKSNLKPLRFLRQRGNYWGLKTSHWLPGMKQGECKTNIDNVNTMIVPCEDRKDEWIQYAIVSKSSC